MARHTGKSKDDGDKKASLGDALDDAAKQVPATDLGSYTVEKIEVEVGNPKITEYKVTISK